MEPNVLIVFDYSGTLSLEAPEFSRSDLLLGELDRSGLTAFGIDHAEIFWEDIVNPTWEEGSTTGVGYIPLIVRQVERRLHRLSGFNAENPVLYAAAASFVHAYLDHSVIAPAWCPLLKKLSGSDEAVAIIATDHYAEATDAIMAHLQRMHIDAAAVRDFRRSETHTGKLIVANSADLGVHKSQQHFWEMIRMQIPSKEIRRVLIVDDFGSREQTGDAYGAFERVALRRRLTLDMMKTAFAVPVRAVDIVAGSPDMSRQNAEAQIKQAVRKIEAYLNEP